MKSQITTLVFILVTNSLFAQNISVDVNYFLDQNIKTYSNLDYTPFTSGFSLMIGDKPLIATTKDKRYKSWKLKSGKETIKVTLISNLNYYKWSFGFGDDTLIVWFNSTHDPRALQLEFRERDVEEASINKYLIKNYEPDCNSAFGLYNKKNEDEYEYYIESANYEHEDALMYAVAKNECDTAKWNITIAKDTKVEHQVITAFCFTSILAMNVRFIGKFNW